MFRKVLKRYIAFFISKDYTNLNKEQHRDMQHRQTLIVLLLFIFFTAQVFAQNISHGVTSPATYLQQRLEALELIKNSKWEESAVILKGLLEEYQGDSDLFYLTGICSYETGNYPDAITFFRKSLESGGASIRGVPTGSSPSNDIMVKIAMAYGKLGHKDDAILWLNKAFDARYDEKPFVMGDSAFEGFKEDKDFLELFGISTQKDLSRKEAWEGDLSYLERQIAQMNYTLRHGADRADIAKSIVKVKTSIPTLSDEEIIVEIMKIVGSLGNGHNLIIPTTTKYGTLKKLPIQLYQFSDGMFIVDANDDYKEWIGYKVESIGNLAVEEVLLKSNEVNSRDNDMQTLWLGPYYICLPDVLKGLGVIENADMVSLGLKDKQGCTKKIDVASENWNFSGFPKLPKLSVDIQPLFLSKMDTFYWSTLLPEHKAMYIQFNTIANKEDQPLKMFCEEWFAQSQEQKVQNVILDIRHNHGGNGSILSSMHQAIRNFKTSNPDGRLFVIAGRETYSAAQNLLTVLTKYADPIIVGEPSGSSPNHIGEAGWVRLPNSGLMAIISTQFHQTSFAEDHRKWIAPHMPVFLSSTDYFSGKDKALEEIIKVIQALSKK